MAMQIEYEPPRTRGVSFTEYIIAIESNEDQRKKAFSQFDKATCRLIDDLPANDDLFLNTPERTSNEYAALCSKRAITLQNSILQSNPDKFDKDLLLATTHGVFNTLDAVVEAHKGLENDSELQALKRLRAWWQIRADIISLVEFSTIDRSNTSATRTPVGHLPDAQNVFDYNDIRTEW